MSMSLMRKTEMSIDGCTFIRDSILHYYTSVTLKKFMELLRAQQMLSLITKFVAAAVTSAAWAIAWFT